MSMSNVLILNGPLKGEVVDVYPLHSRRIITTDDTPTFMQEITVEGRGLYRYWIKKLTYGETKFLAGSLIPNNTDTYAPNWCQTVVTEAFDRYVLSNSTDSVLEDVLAAKVAH